MSEDTQTLSQMSQCSSLPFNHLAADSVSSVFTIDATIDSGDEDTEESWRWEILKIETVQDKNRTHSTQESHSTQEEPIIIQSSACQ